MESLGQWDPDAVHMTRMPGGLWRHALRVPHGTLLEFKITRGSWTTEAVGADGLELPNYRVEVIADTTLNIAVAAWRDLILVPAVLSPSRMANKGGVIELIEGWRFAPGDDTLRAEPGHDDSGWERVSSLLPADSVLPRSWSGVGWFRVPIHVDSAWFGRTLALYVRQTGASEIFLNGRRVARFGTVGETPEAEDAYTDRYARMITLGRGARQVIAVRYSNFAAEEFHRHGREAGFLLLLVPPESATINSVREIRTWVQLQTFFTTVALGLALLHLLLFAFDSSERAHLYFSMLMSGIAFSSYVDFHLFLTSPVLSLWLERLNAIPAGITLAAALLTVYALTGRRFPLHAWGLLFLAAGVLALAQVNPRFAARYGTPVMVGAASAEVLRVLLAELLRRRQSPGAALSGDWIGGAGAAVYVGTTLLQLLLNAGVIRGSVPFPPFYVGFLVFALSISAGLARRWAATNRMLRLKLAEVQELSVRSLEQERRAREAEVERRLVEADNERKTRELEDARRLQLSMLPRSLPEVPGLSIAVAMTTATEVGGDYYDFLQDGDGALTIAVGDATGHGMKAGIMVALMKSLFHTLGHSFYFPDFFAHATGFIRRMNMEGMYMGLTLVRITRHGLTAAAAGMPPILLFRVATGSVEKLVIKGMPLGAHPGYPYEQVTGTLAPGDVLLAMSDGLPELFNAEMEMFDFERLEAVFLASARGTPEEVLAALRAAAETWRGSREQQDDMTFVVVKREREEQ
jgi:serine phosphatase RsbU (regulator of sigma subunit)